MTDTVADWEALVHDRYPPSHAADWDAVGLQVGDGSWPVERVLVTLDVTSGVIEEAAGDGRPTLVLAHHPLLFRPLERLTPATAAGGIALAAAQARVAVLAAHTNLDVSHDGAGTSDPVMRVLGIAEPAPLTSEMPAADELKLVTFVPHDHADDVLDALATAGAGVIGDYERCSFTVAGTGTFRPGPKAVPFSGEVGRDNAEPESRIEMVVPRGRVAAAVAALRERHPYEEVAFDLYPLVAAPRAGFGLVGDLASPRTLRELAEELRAGLPAPHLRTAGDLDRPVGRVAAVGGSGESLIDAAIRAGADVYVTGDLKHHPTLDAVERGLALIDAGHHATEHAAMGPWRERLAAEAADRGLSAVLVASRTSTVPWS